MYDYDRPNPRLAAALDPATRSVAEKQLAAYGYTLSDDGEIKKGEKSLKVMVTAKGKRFYAKQQSGAQLWSGPDLGTFVSQFWYAKKV